MEHTSKKAGKAIWNFRTTEIFCDICVTAVKQNMRPGTHFNVQGWKYVVENFQQQTGMSYDKTQLKNRWDQLKADWKLWKELNGKETGLGWNPQLETVDASADWWATKIEVNREYAKFRKKGIHPDIESKNDIMFANTVALGADCYTPGMETDQNINVKTEGCSLPVEDLGSQSMNIESSSQMKALGKRKVRNPGSERINENLAKFVELVEKWTEMEATLNPPGCTIHDVMQDLMSLTGISDSDEIFYVATVLFEQKPKRELWKSFQTTDQKLRWLNFQYEQYKKFGRCV